MNPLRFKQRAEAEEPVEDSESDSAGKSRRAKFVQGVAVFVGAILALRWLRSRRSGD